jgi:adenine/guanine phosphoribosyltransferase-like PRPP-binding protein
MTVEIDLIVESLAAMRLAGEVGVALPDAVGSLRLKDLYRRLGVEDLDGIYRHMKAEGAQKWMFTERGSFVGGEAKRWKLIQPTIGMSSVDPTPSGFLLAHAIELSRALGARPDFVIGLAQSGIPLACAVSIVTGVPLIVSRVFHSDHALFPGSIMLNEPDDELGEYVVACEPRARVWLIDDEITTGASLLSFVSALRGAGVNVIAAGVAFEVVLNSDCESGARRASATAGLPIATSMSVPYPSHKS